MRYLRLALLALFSAPGCLAAAPIYRCEVEGVKKFQNAPCADAAQRETGRIDDDPSLKIGNTTAPVTGGFTPSGKLNAPEPTDAASAKTALIELDAVAEIAADLGSECRIQLKLSRPDFAICSRFTSMSVPGGVMVLSGERFSRMVDAGYLTNDSGPIISRMNRNLEEIRRTQSYIIQFGNASR